MDQLKEIQMHRARNEGGQYCWSTFALFDLNGISQNYTEGNCSGALAANFCPSGCHTILEDFSLGADLAVKLHQCISMAQDTHPLLSVLTTVCGTCAISL